MFLKLAPIALALLVSISAFADNMSPEDSALLFTTMQKVTNVPVKNFDRITCHWTHIRPALCAYTSPNDRDSFLWHASTIAKILVKYRDTYRRQDGSTEVSVTNVQCSEAACSFE